MSKPALEHINYCQHTSRFNPANPLAERGTLWAVIITAVMMVAEIVSGILFNSMALLADGWHMSSHVIALGVALFAYILARKHESNHRFSFGTWKIEVLGGYTSAILLAGVAVFMAVHSVDRLINPKIIDYNPAIVVAVLGLMVNLVCAGLLHHSGHDHHHHSHDYHSHNQHDHSQPEHSQHHHSQHIHPTHEHHHDLNLRAAYLHVLADALTSIFAIIALVAAKFWGFDLLDPIMGIVGSILVFVWAISLIKQTAHALLDASVDQDVQKEVKALLTQLPLHIQLEDLHVWRIGKNNYACIISLSSAAAIAKDDIRQLLSECHELVHITVETMQETTMTNQPLSHAH